MKTKKHLKDRFILAVMRYFGVKIPNIRQTTIIPGKYYDNFGNIVKATPITRQENLERQTMLCNMLEERESRNIEYEQAMTDIIKSGCMNCPFYERLPCPINLYMTNGSKICESHKFVIIQKEND